MWWVGSEGLAMGQASEGAWLACSQATVGTGCGTGLDFDVVTLCLFSSVQHMRASFCVMLQVEVATKYSTVKTLRQQYIFCPQKYKETFLVYTLNELSGSTSIVFTRTCDSCRKLTLMLRNLGFGAVSIHGQMTQPKRLAALHKFKAGESIASAPPAVCMHATNARSPHRSAVCEACCAARCHLATAASEHCAGPWIPRAQAQGPCVQPTA
jgi:hypothetical protein